MEIYINPEWDFYEVVSNIRALRTQYEDILRSFAYFQIKDAAKFKHETRSKIYALNIFEWQADKLWEFMNGFCPYSDFIGIIMSCKRRNRQNIK